MDFSEPGLDAGAHGSEFRGHVKRLSKSDPTH